MPDAVSESSRPAELQFSIHSQAAVNFCVNEIQAKSWVTNILQHGYMPEFVALPPPYCEPNNKSVRDHLDIVREKLAEWVQEGFVEQLQEPAHCCNPLGVAVRYDASGDKLKYRPVLDLSRHVNLFVKDRSVQLDDLHQVADILVPGDYMLAFDLKNQFFHVRLHPEARKYFGFAVPDEQGQLRFYQFTVMVYGLKSAVHVVTRLILPLKAYIHRMGIRFSIYIDDGRCVATSADGVFWQQKLVLHIFQLAGWNVNWEKTVSIPSQSLLYQGFITDTTVMKYFAPQAKIVILKQLLQNLLSTPLYERIGVRLLALVLGKIVSMLVSHGSVLRILSRAAQQILGSHVAQHGWSGSVELSSQCRTEFSQLLSCLSDFNGQHIHTAHYGITIDLEYINYLKSIVSTVTTQYVQSLDVSDSISQAYHLLVDGSICHTQDFVFSGSTHNLGDSVSELLALRLALLNFTGLDLKFPANIVFWPTVSHTFFGLLTRGSRLPYLQTIVLNVKLLEQKLSLSVRPLWMPCSEHQLNLESLILQSSVSTDEWSVDRISLLNIFRLTGLNPDVDCFSADFNAICPTFFSRTAHGASAGVNFFMQPLLSDIVYFCCPPVHLVIACFRRLVATPQITSYFLFPDWPSAGFWPIIFPLPEVVRAVFKFRPSFFYANEGASHVFSPAPSFDMWALLIRT